MASQIYDKSDDGKVYCGKNIMLSIINLSAKEISGVASLCPNVASKFKRFFSSNYFEGVKVSHTPKKDLIIDIYLKVFYGYSVADVAYRVQENVKNGIKYEIIEESNIDILPLDDIFIHQKVEVK